MISDKSSLNFNLRVFSKLFHVLTQKQISFNKLMSVVLNDVELEIKKRSMQVDNRQKLMGF